MLTLNDIINVSFRKAGISGGYRSEDVDEFIDQVRESYDMLMKKSIEQHDQLEKSAAEKAQMEEKIQVLADKIQEYRKEEDEIKTALISAQKLGDSSVREARHKAEIILSDANLKAERIVSSAENEIKQQKDALDEMKKQVGDFRSSLLDMYKQHLTLINSLPHSEKPAVAVRKETPAAAVEEPAPAQAVEPEETEELVDLQEAAAELPAEQPEAAEEPVPAEEVFSEGEEEARQPEPVSFAPTAPTTTQELPADYLLQPSEAPRFDGSVPDVQRAKERHGVLKFGDDYDLDDEDQADIFGKKK